MYPYLDFDIYGTWGGRILTTIVVVGMGWEECMLCSGPERPRDVCQRCPAVMSYIGSTAGRWSILICDTLDVVKQSTETSTVNQP